MRISDRSSDVCSSDLVRTIGADDYVDGSLMKVDGKVYDLPYTLGNFSILWYRDDLLEAAGVGVPGNWEDLRAAAATLTDEDTKGFIFPAGKNRMTSIFFTSLMWSAGGTYFDKDLNVRAEERRVGEECVSTCSDRGLPHH